MPKNKKQRKPILDVIDGNNWVNRAYYAAPKLTTSKGIPTGAVRAFVAMVNKLIKHRIATRGECYLVVTFDNPTRTTWRSKEMASYLSQCSDTDLETLPIKFVKGYKGTRPKSDGKEDDLGPQFALCKAALDARGIKHLQVAGYEADDVIGTFAHKADCLVMIQSRDKDFAQLLKSNVRITQQEQSNSPERVITRSNCLQEFGIKPKQFVDFLALAGDGCDNIPGIPGIGDKTAKDLITEYGSIRGILKAAADGRIKGAKQKKLTNPFYVSLLDLSHKLAKISTCVQIDTDHNNYKLEPVAKYSKSMARLQRRLEFRQLFSS